MKLIETPVNSNLNLKNLYPTITQYLFSQRAIKYYKLYSLDNTQIAYVDVFDHVVLIMMNGKRKIPKNQVDFAIHRLLHTTREAVTVHAGLKQEIERLGKTFSKPCKDIITVVQTVPEDNV